MNKLSGNYLKIIKAFHIAFIAISFGGLIAIEAILYLKLSDSNLTFSDSSDFIIYSLNNGLIYYSFLGIATTALIYSLYSSWGFLRFYWIFIKWLLLLLIAVIYVYVFSPYINALASLSDPGLQLNTEKNEYTILMSHSFRLNIVLIIIYVSVFFISTIKPFGKRKNDLLSENKIARITILCTIIFTVTFGVFGSVNLNKLRNMDIQDPNLAVFDNGVYKGKFIGGGGNYLAAVEIINHTIKNIQIETTRKSKYFRFAEPVIQRIIETQKVNVDAITGATTTSKCIMKSVEIALIKTDK